LDTKTIIEPLYSTKGENLMAGVTYENVTKRFGDVTAVGNLSLEIADKEFLVLVGPSGCGKTTALRLLWSEEITKDAS
jgi:multiple sugar transport system ATP-binding protein